MATADHSRRASRRPRQGGVGREQPDCRRRMGKRGIREHMGADCRERQVQTERVMPPSTRRFCPVM
ncbi:hypothetical protein D3H34_08575 [Acidovorax cavernicola]|uniref:Uncharacterized protein n=1 Tax=Acidovorax cavernicola TaxID=1675792 RepID=A0A9X8D6N7_9BURK|nr:hypothetical protein D3H34_08575 [Acidovorax cavernicola]